jgi:hypothetical protein
MRFLFLYCRSCRRRYLFGGVCWRSQQLQYKIEVPVVCVDAAGGADVIKVFVATTSSCVPLISAAVNMPMSEAVVQ